MVLTDLSSGRLSGQNVVCSRKVVGDLAGYWLRPESIQDADALLYETQTFCSGADGAEGVVLWGNTTLMPGTVGGEYFMTRGHRHVKATHGELCVTVSGRGAVMLMDGDRRTWIEEMAPGSTHWIAGTLAHRTINTGSEPLVFLCAWPADCGHNYDEIAAIGFGAWLCNVDGEPVLTPRL